MTGLEPVTLRLSSACSNQLSYTPLTGVIRPWEVPRAEVVLGLVELGRLELPTYSLQSYRSTT